MFEDKQLINKLAESGIPDSAKGYIREFNNKYRIEVKYRTADNQRKSISFVTDYSIKNNKRCALSDKEALVLEVKKKLQEYQQKQLLVVDEVKGRNEEILFSDYILNWLNAKSDIQATTYVGYQSKVKNIVEFFLNEKLGYLNLLQRI